MFLEVQKLELFSKHKPLGWRQFLNLTGLQPPGHSRFARGHSSDATFLLNPSADCLLAQFKSFSFDTFGNISRLIAQGLG
jgi:hypothetical protein